MGGKARVKSLVIKESEWGHGPEDGGFLCNTEGKKCCLGFWEEQFNKGVMVSVDDYGSKYPKAMPTYGEFPLGPKEGLAALRAEVQAAAAGDCYSGASLEGCLAGVNDSESIPVDKKKALIRKGFGLIGIPVRFVK